MTYTYTTQQQLRAAFWGELPDWLTGNARIYVRGQRQNDYPADTRTAWCDWIDSLQRSGQISEALAQRATL